MSRSLLLLSGGLDSTVVAAWLRPAHTLTIDYGQVSAAGELEAGRAIAGQLDLPWSSVRVDCSDLGSGLLAAKPADPNAPVPEWWPYRNQLLVTIAGAWGLPHGYDEMLVGSVSTDAVHRDGTVAFYEQLDRLVALQEGGLRVRVPAIGMTSAELLRKVLVPEGTLGYTHSCHRSSLACGLCSGCLKRAEALQGIERS